MPLTPQKPRGSPTSRANQLILNDARLQLETQESAFQLIEHLNGLGLRQSESLEKLQNLQYSTEIRTEGCDADGAAEQEEDLVLQTQDGSQHSPRPKPKTQKPDKIEKSEKRLSPHMQSSLLSRKPREDVLS
jgi:hypothetical protein